MSNYDTNLSKQDYTRLCALVRSEAGIHLGAEKRTMLEARIRRRLKVLEMDSYDQYCQLPLRAEGTAKRRLSISSMW